MDHTVYLPPIKSGLTPARQAGTQFIYPGGMEGWVNLDSFKTTDHTTDYGAPVSPIVFTAPVEKNRLYPSCSGHIALHNHVAAGALSTMGVSDECRPDDKSSGELNTHEVRAATAALSNADVTAV